MRLIVSALLLFVTASPHVARSEDAVNSERISFRSEILPILSSRCYRCHGPDEETRGAGLRLDLAEAAVVELDSGSHAILPGKPEESELLERVTTDDEYLRMPPEEAGEMLSAEEVKLLKTWIEQGAKYERHWSYVKPERPAVPAPSSTGSWSRTPIDRFIASRLEEEELQPSQEASPAVLLRRVSLDLTGLPPTPEQVEAFLSDARPDAYERAVDRLLASPAFGERWGRVWLDLARYADSAGYAQDPHRVIWKYRDWVIRALNGNQPFDDFTIEQLAGDLLPNPSTDQLIATAFHRNTMTNSEGGTDDEEFRTAAVVDRVNTTMQVWMGLTMGCAQCHTHKYDPITHREYFQVYAIFNSTADADRGDEFPTLETFTEAERLERDRLSASIRELTERKKQIPKEQTEQLADLDRKLKPLQDRLKKLQGVRTPIMRELPENRRRKTFIQIRGNFLEKGEEVTRAVPEAFHPLNGNQKPDRLEFAHWLLDRENPLTSRVIANRIWEELFGLGLVETSEDFGLQGELPSHPDLLDWLAVELQESEWDLKRMMRLIVTSQVYRQSSEASEQHLTRDPRNRLLARGPRFRLSAEMIRDQALFVSGLLSQKMLGPSVRPPRPKLGLKAAFGGSTDWTTSAGGDRYRRGLYTSWRRTSPYPSMTTFDAPSREVCTIRRIRTNTPLQALVTLNDPVFVEASQALARRILHEAGERPEERVRLLFLTALSREPLPEERTRVLELLTDLRSRYGADPEAARSIATKPLGPLPATADPVEFAAWTVLANVILNLDEMVARR